MEVKKALPEDKLLNNAKNSLEDKEESKEVVQPPIAQTETMPIKVTYCPSKRINKLISII